MRQVVIGCHIGVIFIRSVEFIILLCFHLLLEGCVFLTAPCSVLGRTDGTWRHGSYLTQGSTGGSRVAEDQGESNDNDDDGGIIHGCLVQM